MCSPFRGADAVAKNQEGITKLLTSGLHFLSPVKNMKSLGSLLNSYVFFGRRKDCGRPMKKGNAMMSEKFPTNGRVDNYSTIIICVERSKGM